VVGKDETELAGGQVVGAMTEPASETDGYDPGPDDSEPATEPGTPDERGEEDDELSDPPEPAAAHGLAAVSDRQRLLASVGFPIAVDGSVGPATTQAVRWFQESWTGSNLVIDGAWGPATEAAARECLANGRRISAHYSLPEFACNHCHWPRANRSLIRGLETLRARYYSGGMGIVSGYRCVVHNDAIGGAKGSQHLYGRAANIPPRGDGGKLITVEMVQALRQFGGLEYQPKISGRGCTHVDVRGGGSVTNPAIFAWG
jgi:hypothetical protein